MQLTKFNLSRVMNSNCVDKRAGYLRKAIKQMRIERFMWLLKIGS